MYFAIFYLFETVSKHDYLLIVQCLYAREKYSKRSKYIGIFPDLGTDSIVLTSRIKVPDSLSDRLNKSFFIANVLRRDNVSDSKPVLYCLLLKLRLKVMGHIIAMFVNPEGLLFYI